MTGPEFPADEQLANIAATLVNDWNFQEKFSAENRACNRAKRRETILSSPPYVPAASRQEDEP